MKEDRFPQELNSSGRKMDSERRVSPFFPDSLNQSDKESVQTKDSVYLYSKAQIPLELGTFDVRIFSHNSELQDSIVISQGSLSNSASAPLFVRMHSECFTGEVLGSRKCDCKFQLDSALLTIKNLGNGLVIYLRQEGRGIGLGNKIKAYDLQNKGLSTVEANLSLGYPNDLRDFSIASAILKYLKVGYVKLNTNNPEKIESLKKSGIEVVSRSPSLSPVHCDNERYLRTKFHQLGHQLDDLFPDEAH